MLEIHLYGSLRRYAQGCGAGQDCVIALEPSLDETMSSLLERTGIPVSEINHIFFNSNLLATRAKTASFMGLPQARSNLSDWNLNIPVNHGDRVGLFGVDMAILSM